MKLQLKFKESASAATRQGVLDKLASRGARKVDPLFPDSADEHLRSLYFVDSGDAGEDLLGILREEEAVEVAEPEVRRRLA